MTVFVVVGVAGDSPPIQMPEGATPLGRGPPLNVMDERLSRRQAELQVGKDGISLTITSIGLNSCFMKEKDSTQMLRLQKNVQVPMFHGDEYYLAGLVKLTIVVINPTGAPPTRTGAAGATIVKAGSGGFNMHVAAESRSNESGRSGRSGGGGGGGGGGKGSSARARMRKGSTGKKSGRKAAGSGYSGAPNPFTQPAYEAPPPAWDHADPADFRRRTFVAPPTRRAGAAGKKSRRKPSKAQLRRRPSQVSGVELDAPPSAPTPPPRARKGSRVGASARAPGGRKASGAGRSNRARSDVADRRAAKRREEEERRRQEEEQARLEQEEADRAYAEDLADQLAEAVQGTDFNEFDRLYREMQKLDPAYMPPQEDVDYYNSVHKDWNAQEKLRRKAERLIKRGYEALDELEALLPELEKASGEEGWLKDVIATVKEAIPELKLAKTTAELQKALFTGITKNRAQVAMTGRYSEVPSAISMLQDMD